jgi:two-component system CheB/CheR fusion protein
MIVEDYRDTAEMLAFWAQAAGHDARICFTGFQAEETAPEYRPDVVLLDIGLPDMNGWELAKALKSLRPVKIAAVTCYRSAEDRRRSMKSGIEWHFGKPVSREQILELLDQIAGAN